jgi:hypothetical protein
MAYHTQRPHDRNRWKHIDGYSDRAECAVCRSTETMHHILFDCQSPEWEAVWTLADKLWHRASGERLPVSMGTLLASNLKEAGKQVTSKKRGLQRLRKILLTESAWTIWVMRNNRVIGGKNPAPKPAIQAKWLSTINRKLELDLLKINQRRYHTKAISRALVRSTWQGIVDKDAVPPDRNGASQDWTRSTEVLVGIPQ